MMISVVTGVVTDLRQDSQTRRRYNNSNGFTMGSSGHYTTYQSKFRLGTVPVSLAGRRSQLINEGENVAVAGFTLFDQLHGVSFKTGGGHIEASSSGYISSIFIGAALILLSFFITSENIARVAPNFADEFFAPFFTFVRWLMLRLMGAFVLLDGLKNLFFVNMLRDVKVEQ